MVRASCMGAFVFVLVGCPGRGRPHALGDADARDDGSVTSSVDAANDTTPPREVTVTVRDPRARFVLATAPLRVRLEHSDGTPWLGSPSDVPFLEVGAYPGGPSATRFHDPRADTPTGVQWRPLRAVSPSALDGGPIVLDDARVGPVQLDLDSPALGVYHLRVRASGPDAALLRFNLAADDGAYHGLGERFGSVDARGSLVPMQLHVSGQSPSGTNETHVPVPFFVNTHAYGMFVDSREAGAFDVASTLPDRVRATFEGAAAELYFFAAGTPSDVIAMYTRHSGLPRLPPRWVYGPMQWRNEWASRAELLDDALRLRAERLPTTTMWIDNPWETSYNDHVVDTQRFPDPAGMIAELGRLGYRVLLWSAPYLDAVDTGAAPTNTAEQLFVTARDSGWLVQMSGATFVSPASPGSRGGMIDFTSPSASMFWTARVRSVVEPGVRGFKLDYGEDILSELANTRTGMRFASGETERTAHSRYPQLYHAAYRAALDAGANGDGFLLVRASSHGGQTVADVIWPGDLDSDFTVHDATHVGGLPAAVNALMSLAASGFPNFGSDTGGFIGEPTREALLRWAEHTALTPVMQLGGGGMSHNPWNYDTAAVDAYRALARLHNDLVPYLRMGALAASRDGTPPVLSLSLAFPDDPSARSDGYSYMLGPDLLVAPVVLPSTNTRRVHVPAGVWVHWFTRSAYRGPVDVDIAAPIGQPVLLMRAGAVVPMLAGDVDTLVASGDATVVSAADRASVLRARIVPAGRRSVQLEDGTRLQVDNDAGGGVAIAFAPSAATRELRAWVDLANRDGGPLQPVAVAKDGVALVQGASVADVTGGCDGCYRYETAEGVLYVGIRGGGRIVVR